MTVKVYFRGGAAVTGVLRSWDARKVDIDGVVYPGWVFMEGAD